MQELRSYLGSHGINEIGYSSPLLPTYQAAQLFPSDTRENRRHLLYKQLAGAKVWILLLEADNIVQTIFDLAGPFDPEEARRIAPDSIRAKFSPENETLKRANEQERAVNNAVYAPDPRLYWVKQGDIFVPAEKDTPGAINDGVRAGHICMSNYFPIIA